MGISIVIFLLSLYLTYCGVAYTFEQFGLPLISILGGSSWLLELLRGICLKWSLGFGIVGIVLSIYNFIRYYKGMNSDTRGNAEAVLSALFVFYLAMSFMTII